MATYQELPLLLMDNNSMMTAVNEGTFKCHNLSLDEAIKILEVHDEDQILQCFNNASLDVVIHDYLGAAKRSYQYKPVRNMRVGQDALVFKLYVTKSETQPVIHADYGVEAKKIQNIYVYCQLISRLE